MKYIILSLTIIANVCALWTSITVFPNTPIWVYVLFGIPMGWLLFKMLKPKPPLRVWGPIMVDVINPKSIVSAFEKRGTVLSENSAVGFLWALSIIQQAGIPFLISTEGGSFLFENYKGWTPDQKAVLDCFVNKRGAKRSSEDWLNIQLLLAKFVIDSLVNEPENEKEDQKTSGESSADAVGRR